MATLTDEHKQRYFDLCTDRMEHADLVAWVQDDISESLNDLPEADAINQILTEFPDEFADLASTNN